MVDRSHCSSLPAEVPTLQCCCHRAPPRVLAHQACDGMGQAPHLWGQLGTFQGDRQALVEAVHQGKGYCQLGFSVLPSLFLCQLCT